MLNFVTVFLVCGLALHDQDAIAQFSTVLNIPPGPNIGDDQSIGTDTQLNLADGGSIGEDFLVGASDGSVTNAELNVTGGLIDGGLHIRSGGIANVSGGTIESGFTVSNDGAANISGGLLEGRLHAVNGSQVNISGGSIGSERTSSPQRDIEASAGSEFNISGGTHGSIETISLSSVKVFGGEFQLDGVPITGLDTPGSSVPFGSLGSSLLEGVLADGTPFAFSGPDRDRIAEGTLQLVASELPPIGANSISLPGGPTPLGIRTGQTLTVNDGAMVENIFNAGPGSTLLLNGGRMGENVEAVNAEVIVSGGRIPSFDGFRGSVLNVMGGGVLSSITRTSQLRDGVLRMSDGFLGSEFRIVDSDVSISGGSISINSRISGTIEISGGTLGIGGHLIGTVNIIDGEFEDRFSASGEVDILGGSFGNQFRVFGTVEISGGTFQGGFRAGLGSDVHISDGAMGNDLVVDNRSTLFFEGGSIGNNFLARSSSGVTIRGGTIGDAFSAMNSTNIHIGGGEIGENFMALSRSTVNLFGSAFEIRDLVSGALIEDIDANMQPGETLEISDRDVTLTGILGDGTAFSFDLNSIQGAGDFFATTATVAVTLGELVAAPAIPEPTTSALVLAALCLTMGRRLR